VAGKEALAQPGQHHGAELADGRDPALAPRATDEQALFGFRGFEDDADRADLIGNRVDDGPDMRAAFGDDDDRPWI